MNNYWEKYLEEADVCAKDEVKSNEKMLKLIKIFNDDG